MQMPITLERIPHDKQVAIRSLQLVGYPTARIARLVGVSPDVAYQVARLFPSNSEEVERCKKQLITESYGNAARAMVRVTDEKLDAMNALQLTTIGAINIDKARDMEGANRPVFNLVNVVADCKNTAERIETQLAAIKSRKLVLKTDQTNVEI